MGYFDNNVPFSSLEGKTLIEIDGKQGDDELVFLCSDGSKFRMYHPQDCCESVYLEDICGDLADLIGTTILRASEDSNAPRPSDFKPDYEPKSETWTFYNIATAKGHVTLRWYGTSNGYYSESVDFVKIA